MNLTAKDEIRFWSKVTKADGCWSWSGYKTPKGYGRLQVGRRSEWAHRVAYHLTYSDNIDGLCVCHSCDNPGCVNPSHLWVGTIQDNNNDKINKGRGWVVSGDLHYSRVYPEKLARGDSNGARKHPERLARGNRNGARLHPDKIARGSGVACAKLRENDVLEIHRMLASGSLGRSIAGKYGVTETIISRIKLGKIWRHVKPVTLLTENP